MFASVWTLVAAFTARAAVKVFTVSEGAVW